MAGSNENAVKQRKLDESWKKIGGPRGTDVKPEQIDIVLKASFDLVELQAKKSETLNRGMGVFIKGQYISSESLDSQSEDRISASDLLRTIFSPNNSAEIILDAKILWFKKKHDGFAGLVGNDKKQKEEHDERERFNMRALRRDPKSRALTSGQADRVTRAAHNSEACKQAIRSLWVQKAESLRISYNSPPPEIEKIILETSSGRSFNFARELRRNRY